MVLVFLRVFLLVCVSKVQDSIDFIRRCINMHQCRRCTYNQPCRRCFPKWTALVASVFQDASVLFVFVCVMLFPIDDTGTVPTQTLLFALLLRFVFSPFFFSTCILSKMQCQHGCVQFNIAPTHPFFFCRVVIFVGCHFSCPCRQTTDHVRCCVWVVVQLNRVRNFSIGHFLVPLRDQMIAFP